MNKLLSMTAGVVLGLSATVSNAVPFYLTTHNNTGVESNAWVNGHPSPYPSQPFSTNKVMWGLVQLACAPIIVNGTCSADIKMETDTPNPVMLGRMTMKLNNGDITPKSLVSNGYRLTVNGSAELTITKE